MEHDARSVANELIRRALRDGRPITALQVIKLTYFCHAWMLGLYHRPLLEQPVEAWLYGPVVPEVYRSLRRYSGEPVTRPIDLSTVGVEERTYDEIEKDLIDQVWEKYGHFSGVQLSAMTHTPGSPWDQVWEAAGQNAVISDPAIEKYYAQQAKGTGKNGKKRGASGV